MKTVCCGLGGNRSSSWVARKASGQWWPTRQTWNDRWVFDRNESGVGCENSILGMGIGTNKNPKGGKFGKCLGLVSRVHWEKQHKIRWEKWIGA